MFALCRSKLSPHVLTSPNLISKRHFSLEMIFRRIYKVETKNIGLVKNSFGDVIRIDKRPGYHFYNNSIFDLIFDQYPEYVTLIPKRITLKLDRANAEDLNDKLFAVANGVFKFKLSDESKAFDYEALQIQEYLANSTIRNLRAELKEVSLDDYIANRGAKISKSFEERLNEKVSDFGYQLEDFDLPLEIEKPNTRIKFNDGPLGPGKITLEPDDRPSWWIEE